MAFEFIPSDRSKTILKLKLIQLQRHSRQVGLPGAISSSLGQNCGQPDPFSAYC
jgi:hypothetical protein